MYRHPGHVQSVDESESRVLVRLAGDFDVEESAALRDRLAPLVARGGRVELDLRSVTFFGSSGISALVWACRGARAADGDVVIADASPAVCRAIELVGLGGLLQLPPLDRTGDGPMTPAWRECSGVN